MQTTDTQAVFQLVWGANAAFEWAHEHEATLGFQPRAVAPIVPPVAPPPVLIIMNDHDQFVPATLTVPRGTTLTWRNDDTDPHTATADPLKSFPGVKVVTPAGARAWDSGLVDKDQKFSATMDTAGHYIYICTVHAGAGMVATIDVVG